MKTQMSSFVVHWIIEDPKGQIRSKRPPDGLALEKALAKCPGLGQHAFGNPGKRFTVACKQVGKLDGLVHRGSADERAVNCPGCYAIIQKRKEAVA